MRSQKNKEIYKKLQNGFEVFFDTTKTTSGQRFFSDLYKILSTKMITPPEHARVILFNVSAALKEIIKSKLRRQIIILRIDGLYSDRLCPPFLNSFNWIIRLILAIGLRYPRLHDYFAFWANMLNENYGAFARIILADFIIYQSNYSKKMHSQYFSNKPNKVIINGTAIKCYTRCNKGRIIDGVIKLITIYDEYRPSKRVHEIVDFVQWVSIEKKTVIHLTILGYTGKIYAGIPDAYRYKKLIENSPTIRTLPKFNNYNNMIRDVLSQCDIFITFSYRDACPNTVIEAMAHGLPVVGIASGGVPDIVKDAGELLLINDFPKGFYSPQRFECDFPKIDYEQMLALIIKVQNNIGEYRERVRRRVLNELDIEIVANRYKEIMESFLQNK